MNPWIIPGLKHFSHEKPNQKSKNTFDLAKDFTALKNIADLEIKHFQGRWTHDIIDRKRFCLLILSQYYKNNEIEALLSCTDVATHKIAINKKMRRSQKLREQFEELKLKFHKHKNGNNNETEQS